MNKIDVLCVGASSFDFTFSVDRQPGPDEKTNARSLHYCGGGPAANAAVTVARLGLKSAFCGYLGDNIFGKLHLKELKTAGVNTRYTVKEGEQMPLSAILLKPDGKRTLINYRSSERIGADKFDFTGIKPEVILFDGHEPYVSAELLKYAHISGIDTILDAGSLNEGTEMLFDKISYLVCSEKFAYQVSGGKKPEFAIDYLFKFNKRIIITMGEQGIIWKTENGQGSLPAYSVTVKDTTGAGDVFHGAFAACVSLKKEWHYSLMYSSAAAALCCTKPGARSSIPTHLEILDLIKASAVQ